MVPPKCGSRKSLARSRKLEVFEVGLEVSFSGDFAFRSIKDLVSNFETEVSQSGKVSNITFYTPQVNILKPVAAQQVYL